MKYVCGIFCAASFVTLWSIRLRWNRLKPVLKLVEAVKDNIDKLTNNVLLMNRRIERMSCPTSKEPDDFLHVRWFEGNRETSIFDSIISNLTIENIPYDRPIASVSDSQNIQDALSTMLKNNVNFTIIVDDRGLVSGLIDLTDATISILRPKITSIRSPVEQIHHKFAFVTPDTLVKDVVQFFKRGFRYMAVQQQPRTHSCDIISQGAVLRYIYEHIEENSKLGCLLLVDLIDKNKCVAHTFSQYLPARRAFAEMVDCEITSMALVDEYGVMTGVVSLSDIKYLTTCKDVDDSLDQDVATFVITSRLIMKTNRSIDTIITYTDDIILQDALHMMTSENVHQLYKISAESKPVGSITFVDILKAML